MVGLISLPASSVALGTYHFFKGVHSMNEVMESLEWGNKGVCVSHIYPSVTSEAVLLRTIELSIRKIDELDLKMVKFKLCLPVEKEGKGWTEEKAEEGEKWYKRFLKLMVWHPDKCISPSILIDEVWHGHILFDTKKYHQDCQNIFGRYIHHFGYYGLRGEQDAKDLQETYKETCDLFLKHFRETPNNVQHCSQCGHGNCGSTK